MLNQRDIFVLSKALSVGLISIEQYTLFLRELSEGPQTSVQSLLVSKAGISEQKLDSLLADTNLPELDETILSNEGRASVSSAGPHDETVDSNSQSASQEFQAELQSTGREAVQRYRIVDEIGRGGLGRVLRARDEFVGRDVALKEMLPRSTTSVDRIERFFIEAQLTGQLDHPGISPVHALGVTSDGLPFYAMKLIEGCTLAALIKSYRQLEPTDPKWLERRHELLNVLIDAANAIGFANSRGILHRDVKPLNIMVGDYGETFLVDWGMAKLFGESETRWRQQQAHDQLKGSTLAAESGLGDEPEARRQTIEGTVMGTPAYMSPEQARGAVGALDQRADVFSLGATLYEILAGRPPYTGARDEVLEQARLGRVTPPRTYNRDVPRALEAICLRALAFAPEERYDTARMLAEEITRWQTGAQVLAYREPFWQRAWRWARNHHTLCTSVLVAGGVVASVGGLWRLEHARRVERIETDSRALLLAGQQAFGEENYAKADEHFRQAQGLAFSEPALASLQAEVKHWTSQTAEQEAQLALQREVEEKRTRFRRLYDQAVVHAMLFTGLRPGENARQARQAATQALALWGADPRTDDRPDLPDSLWSESQIRELEHACRALRWVVADALVRPSAQQTVEQRRVAAREALQVLELTRHDGPPGRAYYLRRAAYLTLADQPAKAIHALQQAGQASIKTAEDFYLLGGFRYQQQRFAEAMHDFEQALRRQGDHFWAQYFLGVCQFRLGRWSEAIGSMHAAASRRPELPYIYVLRATAYGQLGDLAAAETDFAKAVELNAKLPGLYLNRGVVRARHGRRQQAVADFRKTISLDPQQVMPYLNLAQTFWLENQRQRALETIDEAIRVSPESPMAYRLRAVFRNHQGDRAAGLADLEQAIAKSPPGSLLRAQMLTEKGRLLHVGDRVDDALAAYQLALDERPDYYEAMRFKAVALVHVGQPKAAIKWFDRYLEEGSLVDEAFRAAARSTDSGQLAADGIFVDGAGQFRFHSQPRRTLAIVYRERGLARLTVGQSAGAWEDFIRSKTLVPRADAFPLPQDRQRFELFRARIGWSLLNNSAQLALNEFEQSVVARPNDADGYCGRGYARVLLGQVEEAIADAEQSLKLGAGQPGLLYNVACIYAQAYAQTSRRGSTPEVSSLAKEYLQKAIELLGQSFEAAHQRAAFYRQQAAQDAAFDSVRKTSEFEQLLGKP